ncbi:MAG: hypothetical protein FWF40_02075, partial [Methanomassiliicoccaceae archaeon]|nr:hypothetical protein [Methanomassiliicoccaceae archaeon]
MSDTLSNSDDRSRMISAGGSTTWEFQARLAGKNMRIVFNIITPDEENAPEWNVTLYDSTGELWSNYRSKKDVDVDASGKHPKV